MRYYGRSVDRKMGNFGEMLHCPRFNSDSPSVPRA
jgi:hypothetical protein